MPSGVSSISDSQEQHETDVFWILLENSGLSQVREAATFPLKNEGKFFRFFRDLCHERSTEQLERVFLYCKWFKIVRKCRNLINEYIQVCNIFFISTSLILSIKGSRFVFFYLMKATQMKKDGFWSLCWYPDSPKNQRMLIILTYPFTKFSCLKSFWFLFFHQYKKW